MKYKIGSMVVLSAAGRKRNHNPRRVRSGFGIVMRYQESKKYPYELKWFSEGNIGLSFCAKEYEIKKVKTPKSNKNKNNS